MNKIFKVIFSKAKGCYVVVSELAKSAGKGTSASHIQRGYKLTLAAAVLSMMMGMAPVGAADPVDLGNNAKAAYDDNGNLTIGDAKTMAEGDNKNGKNNTTIGTQTDTLRNVKGDTEKKGQPLDGSNTILVDGEGKAHPLDLSTEAGGSTAVGYQNKAEGDDSTAIGNNAKITNKPVTYYVDAEGKKTASPENAVWYKDASGNPTKVPQVFRDAGGNTTTTPQYVHTYTEKDPTTGKDVTKTEITSDATKADQKDGQPVYNYQKTDNTPYLYTVTLYQAASNSIAAGTSVTANGSNAVAVGYKSTADNSAVAIGDTASAKENAVAMGYSSTADNSAVAIGDTAAAVENAVAMGKDTKATKEGSIALGKGSEADRPGGVTGWDPKTGKASTKSDVAWKSGEGALSIGNGGASRQITNVAAGSEDSDAVNLAQLKNAMTHYYSVKTTSDTDAAGGNNYLNDGATGNNALAAGVSAVATGDNATAVGTNTYASGTNASAYGYRAVASGSGSVAIGSGTSAQQEGSVAIGGHTQGSHAVQVGTDSTAQSAYSVAVGGHAKGEYSVEVGYGSTAQGSYSTSIGGHAIGKNSIAIGRDSNPASAGGDNSIAIGGHTNSTNDIAIGAGSSTSGGQAIAVGGSATGGQAVSIGGVAGSFQATAVGSGSAATGSQSTAVGGHAGNVYSTAVGQGANATYAYTTAVGNNSTASGDHSTALGYGTSAQGSNTTAIGGANANGTNLTVIGNNSTASASDYWDNISNSTAVGGAHISASDAAAIGSNATVNGQYGVALGHNSNVSYASTGVGEGTKASNTGTAVGYGSQSSGYQSAAVGAGSQATGQNAVSLGGGGAWGDYSIALGSGAGTTAHGIAIGQNSGAWGENAIAIGEGTNAWRANSIVLGKNSKSGADKNIEGYDPRTGVASVDDTSTWYSTDEAVSIGRAEERDDKGNITVSAITRQLNNLAAGTLDTDAVNVAQLKAATQKVNMHDYSVWSPDTETDTNYTNGGAVAKNSMAAGVSAGATGENAVAIGYGAKAKGRSATVIGKNASATGQYAMAFGGLDTTDKNGNPVTMTNTASGASATAFGQGAQAKGNASLAFGHNIVAGVDGGNGQQSVAFGEDTQALGGRSLAFGEKTVAKYNDSVAFGNDTRASSTGATAFGNRTRAISSYSTAWGNATVAADEESTAWGSDTIAGAKLGENGAVTNNYKINPDDKNEPVKQEQMDVHGNLAYIQPNGKTAGIKQMPIDSGTEKHDYVVLAGKDGNTYVRDYQGSLWKVNVAADGTVTVDTTAGKNGNGKVYDGKNGAKQSLAKTTVNGAEVDITPDNVLTKAHEGKNGYTIEGYANATAFGYSTEASGDNATAFGNDTKASAAGATAFGYQTVASGENATAFGENSIAAAKNSLAALGGTVAASATNAAAIGKNAQATLEDSVALGSGAVADRKSGAKGYDMLTKGDTTNTSTAWVSSANAIAVGNGSTLTRQITGVAAGSQDTDAVNVAQLKAAGFKVTTQNNGNISSSILNGDTLDFEAKDNAIVSTSKDSKTITVAVSKTPTFDSATFYNPNPSEGQNNEKVTISNGHISTYNKDQQERAVIGTDNQGSGTLHLINNDLSQVHVYTQNSKEDGNDGITRMYYISSSGDGGEIQGIHTIAVLDDGINYAGDNVKPNTSDKVVVKHKLNSTMDITGGADTSNLSEGNIGVVATPAVEDDQGNITQKGKLEIKLNKDLTGLNTVTAGNAKIGSAPADTLKLTENGAVTDKTAPAGSYVTGLDNKDWDVSSPTYVSGRAATEDQLKKVSDAVNKTAAQHTIVTVNDNKDNQDTKAAAGKGTFGEYAGADKGNLLIAAKDDNGQMTYNIKLNDQLVIGQKGEPGVAGKDGKVTVETKGGTTVVIGHDGEPGKDGKDGLFVTSKDGADGVSITGPNGADGTDGKVGISGTDGKDAVSISGKGGVGHIGLTGPKGEKGKDGISIDITTDLKSATLDDGKNVKTVIKDKEGKETTIEQAPRIQYNSNGKSYEVATMDDGLKFVGDDGTATPVTKKLNDTLQIRGDGTYDVTTHKTNDDGNIKISSDAANGTIQVALSDKINLHQAGALTVGGNKNGDAANGQDPIVIKHFDDKTLDVIGVDKDGKPTTSKEGKAGDYVTGLDNKDWDVSNPTYVSGRAATEDQLKKVSDAVNSAAATAGKHTVVTVNDKDSNETKAEAGTGVFGNYAGADKGNLLIAAKNDNGQMTYNIKLNDQLAIGQKGEPGVAGKDGKDGKVTVETKGGTTVVIGHDGEPGKDGKDGLFVTGKDGADGKSGVSITGPNGADGTDGKVGIAGTDGKDAVSIAGKNGVGHIGLTGQKGEDGKDGVFTDLSTTLGTATLAPAKNEQSKSADKVNADDKSSRIQYQTTVTDKDGKTKTVITHEVATMDDGQKYAGDFGDGASVKLNKTVNVKGNAKKEADLTDGNIGVVSSQSGDNGQLLIKLNKDLNLGDNGSVKMGNTTINNDGMTISKTESGKTTTVTLTDKGLNNGGNKITNVAAGTDGTDAVNVSQLNDVKTLAGQHTTVEAGSKNITVKEGTNSTGGKNYTVDLAKDVAFGDAAKGDKTVAISGTNGTVMAGTGDNKVTVDGSKGQIIAGGDNGVKIGNVEAGDNSLTIYDKDGNATNQTDKAGKYVTNLGNKTWNKDGSYVSGRAATEDQLHQLESNFNTKVNAVEQNHTVVTVNGSVEAPDAGANGTLGNYTDEKKGNLLLAQKKDSTGKITYDLKLNDKVTLGKAGTNGKDGVDGSIGLKGADGQSSIGLNGKDGISVIGADGKNGVSITGSNGLDGKNGIDGKIAIGTPGKDGQPGKDAVSISGRDGVGHIGLTGPKGADGKDGTNIDISTVLGKGTLDRNQNEVKGEDKDGTKDQAARIQYQTTVKEADGTTKPITHEVATMDDGMKYGDDFGNTAKVKLNHQLDIVGDINAGKKDGDKKATKDDLSDGNIGIVATDTVYNDDGTVKENGKMTVKLAKDLKGLNSIESNSVTTGNTTINNGGLTIKTGDANRTITVQDGNVNMGGNQIHHVAPGQAPDDAVNVSQLNATNYAVNKLDTRVNRVGANAAALAALHPLDFDPDDKWDFSAGYGHYKDANAAAVGAFYRPNEDTMFSVGGSFGGGENMVNAGVSVKLGQGNHVSTSRVAMAKEIKDLKKDVADLKAVVNQQSALIDKLTGVNAGELSGSDDLFPDVPANHWAYEYVTRLKQAGILTGYPDGNFAGDRMMTRYEFAAIVYRAIMAGAAANPSLNKDGTLDRLAKEFSSEMKYIRIDTIRKDRNGRPTIQRVRVIKEDEK